MAEKLARAVRTVYKIIFSLLTFALAALFIYEVCDIYFNVGGFTRAIVSARLGEISIAIWLWAGAVIVGLVLWEVIPPKGKKKYGQDVRYSLYRLKKKLPVKAEGELLQDAAAVARYERILKIVWAVVAVLCLVFAAVGLAYLLDFSQFEGEDVTKEVRTAVIKICPYVVCAFALCTGAAIYEWYGAKKVLPHMKKLVAMGKRQQAPDTWIRRTCHAAVAAVESDITLWAVRTVLFVAGVMLIVMGISNGSARDVLDKAIAICSECIGLG